jgi:hypothetical protein
MIQIRKLNIILTMLALLSITGCDNFLEEEPVGLVKLEEIDENIVESLVVGMYEPLTRSRGRLWESHWGRALLLMEEHAVSRIRDKNDVANYIFSSDPLLLNTGWPIIYESIARANSLLKILEEENDITEEIKTKAKGEAHFIRAFNYFQLVRFYGSVPLRIEPITNADDASHKKNTESEIYTQIIQDLLNAENYLPPRTESPGRATKGAAIILLADVYLTLNRLEEARTKAKYLMDNQKLFGYGLIPSFEILYSPTSPTNDEDIFSLKFSRVVAQGSFLAAYSAPISHHEVAAVRGFEEFGANTNAPLLRDWDDNDLRKELNIYNSATINGELVEIEMAGDYTHVYGKHKDPGQPEETASGVDYYMYRFADVLLIFAETENKINGPTQEAYEAVNMVRRRAYGVDINAANLKIDLPWGLSQEEFDNMVFRERGYEFMFEGKRWFDLKRTGRWKTVIPEAGKELPTTLDWPFPSTEILYNEEIN